LNFDKLRGISRINNQRLASKEGSTAVLSEVAAVLRSDEWSKFGSVFPDKKLTFAVIKE
jgi:hypothetical protein